MTILETDGIGLRVVADNWLLQDVAHLLSGRSEPQKKAHWLSLSPQGLGRRVTNVGSIQLQCLFTLLEQIVLCEAVYVMKEYTYTWENIHRDLDQLRADGFIRTFASDNAIDPTVKERYLDEICRNETVRLAHEKSTAKWQRGEDVLEAQVIGGSTGYLAISDQKCRPYAPHPVRGRFLKGTIWHRGWPTRTVLKLHELVDSARVKLSHASSAHSEQLSLIQELPAVSIRCLQESSGRVGPLRVAWEMREEPDMIALRKSLDEMANSLARGDDNWRRVCCKDLEAAVLEAERRLQLRGHRPEDGPQKLEYYNLTFRVPKAMHVPLPKPRHTGIIHRLILTGQADLHELFALRLGIRDKAVVSQLLKDSSH